MHQAPCCSSPVAAAQESWLLAAQRRALILNAQCRSWDMLRDDRPGLSSKPSTGGKKCVRGVGVRLLC